MHNEQPHYTITTTINGERIGHQEIHDPFVRNTTVIGCRDLLRALIRRRSLTVVVHVDGDRHAVYHVMKPIPILPDLVQRYGDDESVAARG